MRELLKLYGVCLGSLETSTTWNNFVCYSLDPDKYCKKQQYEVERTWTLEPCRTEFKFCSTWRVPWTARRSNQSILKEANPEYSLEGPMLKLKLQYFGHLIWRVSSLEKTLKRKDWRQEEEVATEDEVAGWHHRLNGHEFEQTLGEGERETWCAAVYSVAKREQHVQEWHDWATEHNCRLASLWVPVSLSEKYRVKFLWQLTEDSLK